MRRACCWRSRSCDHVLVGIGPLQSVALRQGDAGATGCFVSSIIGVLLVTRAVRRTGKASALVFILAGIIGLGAVLTGETQRLHAVLVAPAGIEGHTYTNSMTVAHRSHTILAPRSLTMSGAAAASALQRH